MGNEMGNVNASGLEGQENPDFDASNKPLEASVASVSAEDVKSKSEQISSPKEEDSDRKHAGLASENPSGISDPQEEKETSGGKEQEKTEVQAPKVSLLLASNDENGIASGTPSENGNIHGHTGLSTEENLSKREDHQAQNQTSITKEGELEGNSSLDTKVTPHSPEPKISEDLKYDHQEFTIAHAEGELYSEDGSKMQASTADVLRLNESRETGEEGPLENEAVQYLDGSISPNRNSEAAEDGDGIKMESMESQEEKAPHMNNTNGKKLETMEVQSKVCHINPQVLSSDVDNKGNEEQLPVEMDLVRNDAMNLQSEAVLVTKPPEPFQLEDAEPEDKYIVLTDDTRKMENGSGFELKAYDPDSSLLLGGLVEESKVEEMETFKSDCGVMDAAYDPNSSPLLEGLVEESKVEEMDTFKSECGVMGAAYDPDSSPLLEGLVEESKAEEMDTFKSECGVMGPAYDPDSSPLLGGLVQESKVEEMDTFKSECGVMGPAYDPDSSPLLGGLVQESKVEEMDTFKSECGVMGAAYIPDSSLLLEGLVEESKVEEMDTSKFECGMMGAKYDENRIGSNFGAPRKLEIEKDFQMDDIELSENDYQVDFPDHNLTSISQEQCKDSEESEVDADGRVPTEMVTIMDSKHAEEFPTLTSSLRDKIENEDAKEMVEKTENSDLMEKNTVEEQSKTPVLSQFHPIEAVEVLLPTCPVSPPHSEDSKQDNPMEIKGTENGTRPSEELNQQNCKKVVMNQVSHHDSRSINMEALVSTPELEKEKSVQDHVKCPEMTAMVAGPSDASNCSPRQESVCDASDHDSKYGPVTPVESGNSADELDQENHKTKIDMSCPVVEVPARKSHEQSSEQSQILNRTRSAKGEFSASTSCDIEAKETMQRFSTESNPENINFREVSKPAIFDFEFPLEERTESDRTPLLRQRSEVGDVFEIELNKHLSETSVEKVDVSIENPVPETELPSPKDCKEESDHDPVQCQNVLIDKQDPTLEKTGSEKLRAPLQNFLKEGESHVKVSAQKTEVPVPVAKTSEEDAWNSKPSKVIITSTRAKEKRKPKSSLFGNCMCCTAVIN
ncbi:PREDICTED: uncharacterized protein LOC104613251 [Nelumbo nucifera]|uniref:Uncharacterized protein LOC104613251 n=2 Tax=Nelumbo nucifera TaxID=4432 RepID=A0A1U8BCT8_NELNU|nr:PREDICTED: uncharacterized protein LOC104613251 [Nelumbo nucifera]XP_019056000.1 PREDICTED: uncharacterized protein LOC104613251 [Nelumbo nucifera]DAD19686.1 TPA_asm: hypothetical protein HUJ06_021149 [Nelumbo nucifera]